MNHIDYSHERTQ